MESLVPVTLVVNLLRSWGTEAVLPPRPLHNDLSHCHCQCEYEPTLVQWTQTLYIKETGRAVSQL